jgi:regulator of protease activity HflC (stomatin/prohibitin superfamily)
MITSIPQNHCRIIERFGRPISVQKSGLAFKLPFFDKVKNVSEVWGNETNKNGVFIELTEQLIDTQARECYSKDNAKITVDAVLSFRISDPIKAVYETDNLHLALKQLVLNEMRSRMGSLVLDDILGARSQMSESIVAELSDTARKWGIIIIRVEIQEVKTDDATSAAMLQQMDADRKSRAAVSEAQGKAKAIIAIAEAEKDAAILRAEGQSQATIIIAEAERIYLETIAKEIGVESAAKVLMVQKILTGYDIITSNPANKVYIPGNTTTMLELTN